MPSKISVKDKKNALKLLKDSLKDLELTSDLSKKIMEKVTSAFDTIGAASSSEKSGIKKAKNSYMFFNMEKQSSPEIKAITDVKLRLKKIGEMWGALSADAKKKYEKMAAEDKKRYEAEVAKSS